jgi:hypothetical protein
MIIPLLLPIIHKSLLLAFATISLYCQIINIDYPCNGVHLHANNIKGSALSGLSFKVGEGVANANVLAFLGIDFTIGEGFLYFIRGDMLTLHKAEGSVAVFYMLFR